MKTVIALILMLALYDASALEIKVSEMKASEDYEERFDLATNLNEQVVVDCQSFVQGLLFGPVGDSVIMLQEWECDDLLVEMKKSLDKKEKHCLEVDLDYSLLSGHKTCQ